MSLTVKAFLAHDGQRDTEIRRFQIPGDISTSFVYLQKKVCEMFPSLKEGNVSLFWKDGDGDVVAFSTDDEFKEALSHVSDGVLKVHVVSKGSKDNQKVRRNKGHPGAVCDVCDHAISGPRYKCLVCPNFDLCKTCEDQGMHMQHNKMKIASPCGPPGPPGFPMFPFGHHGWHHGPGGHHGPHGVHRHFGPPPQPFRRWMQKNMKRWHKRHAPEYNSSGEETEKTDSEEKEENMEKIESGGDQGDNSAEELLQDAGDCMADMITAVGIESDENIENEKIEEEYKGAKFQGRGKKCRGRKMHCPAGHRGRRFFHRMMNRHGYGPYHFGPWALWGLDSEDECPCKGPDGLQRNKCCRKGHKKCRAERASSEESQKQRRKGEKAEKQLHKKDKRHKRRSAEKCPENDHDTVMVLDDDPCPKGSEVLPGPLSAVVNSAQVLQTKERPPLNQYEEVLQQLLTMGFNNDGGWLARLVEAKNGDIGQVLNAINPQRN